MQKYNICRSYAPTLKQPVKTKIVKRGVTLEVAKLWCNDPATKKEGKWFDYYQKQ